MKQTQKQSSGSIRIYDNGGKSFDRYTAVFMDQPENDIAGTFACVAMSEKPFHPQGFGQHCAAMPGKHLGKRINMGDLPQDCRLMLKQEGY